MGDPRDEMDSGLDSGDDSDRELQVAFERGLLKPGLNIIKSEGEEKKKGVNNRQALKLGLAELKSKAPSEWVERLDVVSKQAPIHPQIALEMGAAAEGTNLANDDFKREAAFFRQAQSSVMSALPRLKELGIRTKRPEDYFAEMLKTDGHMQKVRKVLLEKQAGQERADKVKRLRQAKKMAKEVQLAARLDKSKQKRNMLNLVKQYQRGEIDNLDFLEDGKGKKGKQQARTPARNAKGNEVHLTKRQRRMQMKRQKKDEKFGHGGQKKRSKWNTQESASDMSSYRRSPRPGPAPGQRRKSKPKEQRMGKRQRQKAKQKSGAGGKRGKR